MVTQKIADWGMGFGAIGSCGASEIRESLHIIVSMILRTDFLSIAQIYKIYKQSEKVYRYEFIEICSKNWYFYTGILKSSYFYIDKIGFLSRSSLHIARFRYRILWETLNLLKTKILK